jgi:hypothetical protein
MLPDRAEDVHRDEEALRLHSTLNVTALKVYRSRRLSSMVLCSVDLHTCLNTSHVIQAIGKDRQSLECSFNAKIVQMNVTNHMRECPQEF